MKKKTYLQNSISFLLGMLLVFGLALASLFFAIYPFVKVFILESDNLNVSNIIFGIMLFVIFLAITIFFVFIMISESSLIIHMDDKKIWMNDDLKIERMRLQYKTEAYFSDIKDIRLIKNEKDSRLQSFPKDNIYPGKQKYIVLILKDDHVERLNVSEFSKRQIGKIISEIIRRINATGNTYEGQYPLWILNNITSE